MKQLIKDVLMNIATSQPNLHSEAARENIATSIISVIKTKGIYTKYTDTEIDEQKARDSWVCSICGENTYDVEYDYLGSGTNHLGCELQLEKESSDVVAKALGHMDEKGNFITQTEEVDGIYTDEEVKEWEEAVGYVEPDNDKETLKLAEEILDNQGEKWIYESPDSGKTVFRRPFKNYDMKNKVEIDWETKEPTGRVFADYPFD
jgi:hypothetical protein